MAKSNQRLLVLFSGAGLALAWWSYKQQQRTAAALAGQLAQLPAAPGVQGIRVGEPNGGGFVGPIDTPSYEPGGANFVGPIDPADYEPGGRLFTGPLADAPFLDNSDFLDPDLL